MCFVKECGEIEFVVVKILCLVGVEMEFMEFKFIKAFKSFVFLSTENIEAFLLV